MSVFGGKKGKRPHVPVPLLCLNKQEQKYCSRKGALTDAQVLK